jgi:prepilin-type N-terminal cleavage/methylation domain-containing protein
MMNGAGSSQQAGFTMIELLMSMTVFSFMLLIITAGFVNIVNIHNQAIAANVSQDNASSAIDILVKAVRDSSGPVFPTVVGTPAATLCLSAPSGGDQEYFVRKTVSPTEAILYRGDNCLGNSGPHPNELALTSTAVQVSNFQATLMTGGPNGVILKPEVNLSLTVSTNNGTTAGGGSSCIADNGDRAFCSVVTLTSGAVPR